MDSLKRARYRRCVRRCVYKISKDRNRGRRIGKAFFIEDRNRGRDERVTEISFLSTELSSCLLSY